MVRKILTGFVLSLFLISLVSAWSVDIIDPINGSYYGDKPFEFKWNSTSSLDSLESVFNFTINGDSDTGLTNKSRDDLKESIKGMVRQGWNELNISVVNKSGFVENDSINFWVDSIAPNLSYVFPNSNLTYTNQDNLYFQFWLNETNKGDYRSASFSPFRLAQIVDPFGGNFSGGNLGNLSANESTKSEFRNESISKGNRGEGNYTWIVYAKDVYPDGTTTTIRKVNLTGTIIRDTLSPSVKINSPLNATLQSKMVKINVSAQENTSQTNDISGIKEINISIDGLLVKSCNEQEECAFDWNSSLYRDDFHNISAIALDRAGNPSLIDSVLVETDNTAPEINFISPAEGLYGVNQLVNITASDNNLNRIELWVNRTKVNETSLNELTYLLEEGEYEVYAVAYDDLGNRNNTARNISIDTTPPSIELQEFFPILISPKNNDGILDNSSIDIRLSERADVVLYIDLGYENYSLYSSSNVTNPQTKYWTGINSSGGYVNEGIYYVYVNATDAIGNSNNSFLLGNITIDNTAPVITVNGTDVQIERGTEYIDDGATTDDGTVVVIDNSSLNVDGVGKYTITYDANDSAGNVAVQKTRNVEVIDRTAPEINIASPLGSETYYPSTQISLEADVNENISSWQYSFDKGVNRTAFNLLDTINLSVGHYNITFFAFDLYGNEGNDTVSFNVTEEPVIQTFSGGGGSSSTSYYNCTKWSEWSSCIDGIQSRKCLDKNRVSRSKGGVTLSVLLKGQNQTCFVSTDDTPEMFGYKNETDEEQEPVVEERNSFISRMTGAAVGFAKSKTGLIVITFTGALALALSVLSFRKRLR